MKRINAFKKLLFVALCGASSVANAQVKALAFPGNFYKNYVGLRFEVVSPSSIAGDKQYTTANDGGTGTVWGAAITATLTRKVIMLPGGDSMITGTLTPGSMVGKIAVVYRGGSIEFGRKAQQCQVAGADACVIVNNVGGGPVGMAAGTYGGGVTIPVFMISNADGNAIDARYCNSDTATITITNWGQNLAHDLGYIPGGLSTWHAFAVPSNQVGATGNPDAYKAVDGAFVGNFGTAAMPAVTLTTNLSFTPTGTTTATPLHTSSVSLTNFAALDSIWAMFDTLSTATNVYDVAASSTGRFDQTFSVASTTADDFPGDNTATSSFYLTDSLYSKGRYDFPNNKPFNGIYQRLQSGAEFLWGPMYFVKTGGASVSRIQYSFSQGTAGVLDQVSNNVYLFKWVDGSRGLTTDNIIQNGELELVGMGVKTFDVSTGSGDTSGAVLNLTGMNIDTTNGASPSYVTLESNTWYYLAIDIPAGYYLGCDGTSNPYPRAFGRFYNNTSVLEYNNMVHAGIKDDLYTAFDGNNPILPFTGTSFIQSIDSFNYANTKGLIPSVAMIVNNSPGPIIIDKTAVNTVKSTIGLSLFPNPAKDNITVSVDLEKPSTVTYTIIDGLARFVSKETHNNVQSEKNVINTSKMAAGNYFLIVNANGTATTRKFTVVK